jgi:hypothetical protein
MDAGSVGRTKEETHMKTRFLALAAVLTLVPVPAHAQLGTRARATFDRMFDSSGRFGVPGFAADPFTCDSTHLPSLTQPAVHYYNTVSLVEKYCDGTAWRVVAPQGAITGSLLTNAASLDLGSAAKPFRDLYLYGSGTYATTSVKLTGTPTGARVVTFPDSSTTVPIASQQITFAGPTTARTYTLPDAADTLGGLGAIQTWTAANTFNAGFTTSSTTTLSGATAISGVVTLTKSIQGTEVTKTLTESSATVFATVTVATSSRISGIVEYSLEANDATDFQIRAGVLPFSAVNKAGTITCSVGTPSAAVETAAVSAGTFTWTPTCADATGGVLNILANAVSSLTQTTLQIRAHIVLVGTATVAYP